MITSVSLFDVEDMPAAAMPKVRDMTVSPVTAGEVREFCRRYHYTGSGGADGKRFGLWYGPTLLGVVTYSPPTRSTCESVFGPEHFDKVWHMGRLVLAEAVPRNGESRLIGGSLRLLEQAIPPIWVVVTYAAIDAGHVGYVYQATNALYTGLGGHTSYWLDLKGRRKADHLNGQSVSARAAELGLVRVKGAAKASLCLSVGQSSRTSGTLQGPSLACSAVPQGGRRGTVMSAICPPGLRQDSTGSPPGFREVSALPDPTRPDPTRKEGGYVARQA